jgi:hypothetical protein
MSVVQPGLRRYHRFACVFALQKHRHPGTRRQPSLAREKLEEAGHWWSLVSIVTTDGCPAAEHDRHNRPDVPIGRWVLHFDGVPAAGPRLVVAILAAAREVARVCPASHWPEAADV